MRSVLTLMTLVALFGFSNRSLAHNDLNEWAELVAFHKVMSQTFHPSEEGNLEPIKTRIGELVEKAKALQTSKIPDDFNNKKVKKAVTQLYKDSKALQKKIGAGASDADIKAALAGLHDVFHKIVGLCSENEDHDHNEGEHKHQEEGHQH